MELNNNEKKSADNNKHALRVMLIFAAMLVFVVAYAVYTKS
jgi:hypothetical protein